LQTVAVELEMYLSYGAGEVEATLSANLGTGTTQLVISPSGTTESASNPEYTIINMQLVNFTPSAGAVGELSMVTASFVGGTYARDITSP
jgi:ABC-type xylose transport system permease subunit